MTADGMQLEDWLDDLCVRFIINLPQEDLSSVARICFQVEEAQWFYEDFIRPLDPNLPSMSLRTFCLRIFQHCPLLASFSVENHTKAFEEFLQYKTRVPVRGAIMLNHMMDSVVLVKGWKKGANWSFPRGKINKDEDDLDCAIREVYEETGLDLRAAGLAPDEKKPKYIEIPMREQQLRLYVFRDIPMDTKFQPRTRKEISKIQWYRLSELPAFRKKGVQNQGEQSTGPAVNRFYMVAPFLVPLKKWILSQRRIDDRRAAKEARNLAPLPPVVVDDIATTEDDTWAPTCPEPASQVPAIETLDGATRELRRLLKMQPPTQGIQVQPEEDKGTALLSILQSNSDCTTQQTYPTPLSPQSPQRATGSAMPRPPGHAHHFNTARAPSTRQIPQHSPSVLSLQDYGRAPGNLPPGTVNHAEHRARFQSGLEPPHYVDSRNNPLFASQGSFQQPATPQPNSNHGPQSAGFVSRQSSLSGQLNQSLTSPSSARLGEASAALLSAFKRDAASPQTSLNNLDAMASAYRKSSSGQVSHDPLRSSSAAPLSQAAGGSASRQMMEHSTISEVVGSSTYPAGVQHRSALLDIFNQRHTTNAGAHHSSEGIAESGPSDVAQRAGQPPQEESASTRQLDHHHHDASTGPKVPLESYPAQENHGRPALSSTRQGGKPIPYQNQHRKPVGSPLVPGRTKQPSQVPRILKRGQSMNQFNDADNNQQSASSATALGFASAKPAPGHTGAMPEPTHGPSPGYRDGDSHGPREKKEQLLSLFGKQPVSGNPNAGSGRLEKETGNIANTTQSMMPSKAPRAEEAPMSAAERTFLLDYLQSVTKNAGRG